MSQAALVWPGPPWAQLGELKVVIVRLADWPSNWSRRVRVSGIWVGMDRARGIALNSPRRETDDVRCITKFAWPRMSGRCLKSIAWNCLICDERS